MTEVEIQSFVEWAKNQLGLSSWDSGVELLSDEDIRQRNRELLNHDYPTDVITVDLSSGPVKYFELYIGLETVEENAREHRLSPIQELRRCLVHGLLHLKGWEDSTADARQGMRDEENRLIRLFHVEHNLRYDV